MVERRRVDYVISNRSSLIGSQVSVHGVMLVSGYDISGKSIMDDEHYDTIIRYSGMIIPGGYDDMLRYVDEGEDSVSEFIFINATMLIDKIFESKYYPILLGKKFTFVLNVDICGTLSENVFSDGRVILEISDIESITVYNDNYTWKKKDSTFIFD